MSYKLFVAGFPCVAADTESFLVGHKYEVCVLTVFIVGCGYVICCLLVMIY